MTLGLCPHLTEIGVNTEDISHWSAEMTVQPPAVHHVAHNLSHPDTARQPTLSLLTPAAVLQQIQDSPFAWCFCFLAPPGAPLGFASSFREPPGLTVLPPVLVLLCWRLL